MSAHTWGWIFLSLGILLLIAELVNPGIFIGVMGISLIVGAIGGILYPLYFWQIFLVLVIISLVITGFIFSYLYRKSSDFSALPVGLDAVIGQEGVVTEAINFVKGTGKVKIGGETWRAKSAGDIAEDTRVLAVKFEGSTLNVIRTEDREPPIEPSAEKPEA
jgi:membrane protein implicated in regulation of membrane protease activity